MDIIHIENHTPSRHVVSDPRGGFSVNIDPKETVVFDVDEERRLAMTGRLVRMDNMVVDGVKAFTIKLNPKASE